MKWVCGNSLILLLILQGCSTAPRPAPEPVPPSPPVLSTTSSTPSLQPPSPIITKPKLSTDSFNPTKDKPVAFSFKASRLGDYIIKVWDADGGLIRNLPIKASTALEPISVAWDGKDDQGQIVPDEAYTFTVQDNSGAFVYNPLVATGGLRIDITKFQYSPEEQRIHFELPFACRILLRAGTKPGPLLANLVDWEPRRAGEIIEPWRGLDDSGRLYVPAMKNFILSLTGYSLPESTVLLQMGSHATLSSYRATRPSTASLQVPDRKGPSLHPQFLRPLSELKSPRVRVIVKNGESPIDVAVQNDQSIDLVIDVEGFMAPHFAKNRFEVVFYLDNEPLIEEGQGFVPYLFRLKGEYISPGRHFLVINAANFTNQYGEYSFFIRKELGDAK